MALPAQYFAYVGQKIRITAQGQISNVVTTPGTVTFDVRFGSTVVFTSGAIPQSTTAHTSLPFWIDIELTCRAVGTSANLMGQGRAQSLVFQVAQQADAGTILTHNTVLIPTTTPAVGNNFDSTATQVIDFFGTFSVSNAGTAMTLQQYEVIGCNWGG